MLFWGGQIEGPLKLSKGTFDLREHLQWCLVCDPAPIKLDEEKSKYARVWFRKMVLAQNNCTQFAPAEKSVMNMIWLLFSISDWPIIMIRPGGLLLVVVVPHHLFVVPVLVLWGWIAIVRTMEVSQSMRNEGNGSQMVELSVEFVFLSWGVGSLGP